MPPQGGKPSNFAATMFYVPTDSGILTVGALENDRLWFGIPCHSLFDASHEVITHCV